MKSPLLALLSLLCFTFSASAQSTAFTYQGDLASSGAPANGPHDMFFFVFDVPTGGTDIGGVCVDEVQVVNGKFAAQLDYGALISTAAPRYLEIWVRSDTSLFCGDPTGYTILSPRQLITPAPVALFAHSSGFANTSLNSFSSSLAAVANSLQPQDGSPVNAVSVAPDGKVGIGTTTPVNQLAIVGSADVTGIMGIGTTAPTHSLHITKPGPTIALQDSDSSGAAGGQQVGYVSYRDSGNVERGWVGYGGAGDPDLSIINARPSGDIILNAFGGGNIGIGTASPTSKLTVLGDVKLGSSSQFFALKAPDNDRMIRGAVFANGSVNTPRSGDGFTVARTSVGVYVITFETPFVSAPTMVVSSGEICCRARTAATFTGTATVNTYAAGTTTASDAQFHFIIMGN